MSVHDRGRKTPGKRWEVRWRDSREVQRKRRFANRDAALDWDAKQRVSPMATTRPGLVADEYQRWIATKAGLAAATLADYRMQWRLRVEPAWGHRRVDTITHSDVAAWVAQVTKATSATTARRSFVVLSGVVRQSVRDGTLSADPTAGVRLPTAHRREVASLTVEQVTALAEACSPHQMIVWTLALTGVRFGELVALEAGDKIGERLMVRRSWSVHEGVKSPKSGRVRQVPLTPWLAKNLVLPFRTRRGYRWDYWMWGKIWEPATHKAGLDGLRVHDLRHVAATWAIQSGADVKAVQSMLGHASGVMTLDVYAAAWDQGLDDVARRMDRFRPT